MAEEKNNEHQEPKEEEPQKQQEPVVTNISENMLAKMVNPEQFFKFSNWEQWLANEKSRRRHDALIMAMVIGTILSLFGLLLWAGQIGLINKETMSGLLGAVVAGGITLFTKYVEKPQK